MRIAFVVTDFPTISETFVLAQIVGVINRGHDVRIFAVRPRAVPELIHEDVQQFGLIERTYYREPTPRSKHGRVRSAASRVVECGWRTPFRTLDSLNFLRHGKCALNLTRLHERLPDPAVAGRFDAIHCHFGPNGVLAVSARLVGALQGPIITTFHGYDVNLLPRIHGRAMYGELFAHGDVFTVGSEFLRQRLLSLGAPASRIVKLPMGVDVQRFGRAKPSPSCPGQLKLLTIARLVEVKGIEYALRAIAMVLATRRIALRYTIAGDGPLRMQLEALSAELGLATTVDFVGAVSQERALQLYESADVFILPSVVTQAGEEENQPVVLAEAQAAGLPVIASAIGGISESVCGGKSAILVPQRDPDALAAAILKLGEDPAAWPGMAGAGRRLVERVFNLETLSDELIEIYRMAQVSMSSSARQTSARARQAVGSAE